MSDFSSRNPTGRFSGLAATYDRYRPDYPIALFDYLRRRCGLDRQSLIIDVGCGTGISSRQLAAQDWQVIGVEPNDDMLQVARSHDQGSMRLSYVQGSAENTGLAPGIADLGFAAQAFHWFRADAALCEFHRVLKPDRFVALTWNERDERDAFSAAFGDMMRKYSPEKAVAEASQAATGEALLQHVLFHSSERVEFSHEQVMDREGLIGRVNSVSFGPRDADGRAKIGPALADLFDQFVVAGTVRLQYRTILYTTQARRL